MAKIVVTSANFTSLKGIPTDELEFSEDIQNGTELYSVLLGKVVKSTEFIAELQKNSFYPPQIIIKETGYTINFGGKEVPLAANLDFSEIKKDKEKAYIHLTAGNKKICLGLRLELLESCEYDSRELFDLMKPSEPVETAKFLLTIVVPPTQSSLPDGIYEVRKVEIKKNSTKIFTKCGNTVSANTGATEKTLFIKAFQGFLYTCNADGRVGQGISWIMGGIPLPDKEKTKNIGAADCQVGSEYEILGVSENLYEGNPMYSAMIKCLKSGVSFAIRSDKSINSAFVICAGLNRQRFATVIAIQEPTGNMKYPRPEFKFSTKTEVVETPVITEESPEVLEVEEKIVTTHISTAKKTKEKVAA
jgi:hypothetical protein